MSRDAPMMMRRIRNRNTPRISDTASSSPAYQSSFVRVTPSFRSSIAYFRIHGESSWNAVVASTQISPMMNARR